MFEQPISSVESLFQSLLVHQDAKIRARISHIYDVFNMLKYSNARNFQTILTLVEEQLTNILNFSHPDITRITTFLDATEDALVTIVITLNPLIIKHSKLKNLYMRVNKPPEAIVHTAIDAENYHSHVLRAQEQLEKYLLSSSFRTFSALQPTNLFNNKPFAATVIAQLARLQTKPLRSTLLIMQELTRLGFTQPIFIEYMLNYFNQEAILNICRPILDTAQNTLQETWVERFMHSSIIQENHTTLRILFTSYLQLLTENFDSLADYKFGYATQYLTRFTNSYTIVINNDNLDIEHATAFVAGKNAAEFTKNLLNYLKDPELANPLY